MTNRELLELAAKAAGYERNSAGPIGPCEWNPLEDDGDALRLAVMLRLTVKITDREIEVFNWEGCLVSTGMFGKDDYEATTRYAISRAAAEIGRNME